MWRFYAAGFVILMAFDTLAQIGFKLSALHALPLAMNLPWLWRVIGKPWVYLALLGYVGAFMTWMRLLKKAPIGPAFAASHLEVISIMLCSQWLFHEPVTLARGLGAALILVGIVCLGCAEAQRAPVVVRAA